MSPVPSSPSRRCWHQSRELMAEAEHLEGTAIKYNTVAKRIHQALPVIQRMADAERANTEWEINPRGDIGAEHVFPYTIAPTPEVPASPFASFSQAVPSFLQRLR